MMKFIPDPAGGVVNQQGVHITASPFGIVASFPRKPTRQDHRLSIERVYRRQHVAGSGTWRDDAMCRGLPLDLWFSERSIDETIAVGVCMQCPVRARCAKDYRSDEPPNGTWAGVTHRKKRY